MKPGSVQVAGVTVGVYVCSVMGRAVSMASPHTSQLPVACPSAAQVGGVTVTQVSVLWSWGGSVGASVGGSVGASVGASVTVSVMASVTLSVTSTVVSVDGNAGSSMGRSTGSSMVISHPAMPTASTTVRSRPHM